MTRPRLLLLAGCAVLALAGCGAAPSVPGVSAAATSTTAAAAVVTARPIAVAIPAIAVRSTLIETGLLPDGTPQVPDVHTPGQASWFGESPTPGEVGPAVLFGHVDGEVNGKKGQPGVFHRLRDLRRGDLVMVDRDDGQTATFAVDHVEVIPKAQFGPGSPAIRRVYGDTRVPELRLITCGGEFDRAARSYRDQIVVYAALT